MLNLNGKTVKVLTWNVWFEDQFEERFDAILKVMQESEADIYCLQEVTPKMAEYILSTPFMQNFYAEQEGHNSQNDIRPYGMLIISRWPCLYYELEYKETKQHRSLLLAEFMLPQRLIVCTSHFESSKDFKPARLW